MIACLRALGIPARLHLGKVKNHIGVERLTEKFGTNELTPHGMVNVFLNDKWLKLSPAFNKSMCKMCNVAPLEFDGENNSFLQQFNNEGNLCFSIYPILILRFWFLLFITKFIENLT